MTVQRGAGLTDGASGNQHPQTLRHSFVYYLIFPPDTAAEYRVVCLRTSAFNTMAGVIQGIGFYFLFATQISAWLLAIGVLIFVAVTFFGILALMAARRSQTLNRSTVSFLAAANYAQLASFVYLATWLWAIFWLSAVFWAIAFALFHLQGLRLLKPAEG